LKIRGLRLQILLKSKILSAVTVKIYEMQLKIQKQNLAWTLTQVNLCSTFGSHFQNSLYFKSFKIGLITISSNKKLNWAIKPESSAGMQ